jgi:hypothetical protein
MERVRLVVEVEDEDEDEDSPRDMWMKLVEVVDLGDDGGLVVEAAKDYSTVLHDVRRKCFGGTVQRAGCGYDGVRRGTSKRGYIPYGKLAVTIIRHLVLSGTT